ncbi:MAG: hypothetical protein PHR66_14305, partial [Desulfuromonadaceae bacterium]|nr:hypothetical protein [Desulfuromonadaceae bacterium]
MQRFVMVLCAALLFVPVVMKNRASREIPARTIFRVLSSGRIHVKVSGEVLHPGVYDVPVNSVTNSVIVLAGWKSPLKRYESIPSAVRYLRNGSAVNLSVQPDGSFLLAMGQMTVPERMVLGIPLDISTMSEADFIRLPGIGPALARRIIVYSQNN